MLESRSRQAGQPTFSYKHKVHKQVCLIIKIRRDRSRISKGWADVSSLTGLFRRNRKKKKSSDYGLLTS